MALIETERDDAADLAAEDKAIADVDKQTPQRTALDDLTELLNGDPPAVHPTTEG